MASGFYHTVAQSPQTGQFERSIPFRESKGPIGPFRATKIWNDLIEHFKSKVELKKRRYKMRQIENCFTGTDAVDVVLHFLLNDKDMFSTDLSREKAVKVCQMLMQRKVFQSATDRPDPEKPSVFEDSSSRLYHFIGEHAVDGDAVDGHEEDEEDVQNSTQASDILRFSGDSLEPDEEPDVPEFKKPFREIQNSKNSDVLQTPGKLNKVLESADVDDVWREVALTQLLTLVELTFLDGILSEDKRSRQQIQRDHLIISNLVARSWHLPLTPSALNTPSDPLLQTAVDCIEFLPKALNLLSEPVFRRRGIEAKLWAKDIIVKHFTSRSECLLPAKYLELHIAILNLVLAGNEENALSALQLYMILLPVAAREELYRLLKFMRSVAADTSIRLDPEESNEMVILGLLTNCIFQHKLLASNVVQKLVQFMMTNVDRMLTVPRQVRQKVAIRLYQMKTGKSMLDCEASFCNRVSAEEYKRQSKDCTELSLIELMNSVLDDTSISLKDKKHRLKQFQKSYPDLFERNFEGML
ncbi:DEP domain-containing protein 7-like [Biomphalaria glabrata]|uniref:DEP domain-containing protein 7-like n=1 Tax=Biomphalaria glabrata TaxID=6526 RepID=A0A9U8EDX8_BIOGL|nr:DEP domain-containing protein 7-like [Biomphalaria glabrata]KAI8757781.1 DEP domain-containing protein 7-like [Biomphalaria glabrata]